MQVVRCWGLPERQFRTIVGQQLRESGQTLELPPIYGHIAELTVAEPGLTDCIHMLQSQFFCTAVHTDLSVLQ